MNMLISKPWQTLLALLLLPLIAAYVSQYGFGLEPCILCIYQRIPYAVLAVVVLLYFFLKKKLNARLLFTIVAIGLLLEAAMAFYHVGVEQGVITEGIGCVEQNIAGTIEELRAQLLASPVVACNKPQFMFLGLSMAAWNGLYALGLFAFVIAMRRRYCGENK